MSERIIYVDSRQRDTALYPDGNTYTLHLTTPIRNIAQVDLVSATVPNTIYNLTNGTNVMTINATNITLSNGFYSTDTLVSEFNASTQVASSVATLVYSKAEGRFILHGSFTTLTINSSELATLLGLSTGSQTVLARSSNPVYAASTVITGANYVKSTTLPLMNINDYIWLDIREFRTPRTMDARRLVSAQLQSNVSLQTTLSNTAATSFALIPLDVNSGEIKSFKEGNDYTMSIEFPSRLDSLDRLTIRWLNLSGQPVNFQGFNTNSFTLRVHAVDVPLEPERIESLPAPVEKDKQRLIFYGAIIALIIGLFMILLVRPKR